jgi:molybdopterin-guanine dinucleotide biosynthesis protein A
VTVDAVVLAGGAATRFGGDKLRASFDGDTVLGRAVAGVRDIANRIVVVLGPGDAEPDLAGVVIARDPVAHQGPLAGLVTGLRALEDPGTVLVLAGDMPRVRPAVIGLLVDALAADESLGAVHLEADPVATLPLAVRARIVIPTAHRLLAADRRSLRALLDGVPSGEVPVAQWRAVDGAGDTLRDIDVPADLATD